VTRSHALPASTRHAAAREQHYRKVDLGQLARSLPRFAEISARVLVAVMSRPGCFPDRPRFKSYVGLGPRASETGETDKGQPMSKGQAVPAANHAVPRPRPPSAGRTRSIWEIIFSYLPVWTCRH
jgi:transposase